MRRLAFLACAAGCGSPELTLAEWPKLEVLATFDQAPWSGEALPVGLERSLDVTFRTAGRDCPQLASRVQITVNDVALEVETELGGEDDNGFCEDPRSRASIPADVLGDDLTMVIDDGSEPVVIRSPGVLRTSAVVVAEPASAVLFAAAKVRLTWQPEDLTNVHNLLVSVHLVQAAPPHERLRISSLDTQIDGNEIRFSVPEAVPWTGPTYVGPDGVDVPYNEVTECTGAVLCVAGRSAAAQVLVDLRSL